MGEEIRRAGRNDFQEVARLHSEGIREGFLTSLGEAFLAVLYEGVADTNEGGVLVASDGGRILGYIAFTANVRTCYRSVLSSRWKALARTMARNLFRPSVYRKTLETLLYPYRAKSTPGRDTEDTRLDEGPRPELLSMAVDRGARGRSIGRKLVAALDKAFSERGTPGYYVVTHGLDTRSNGFYRSCGFEKVREFYNHGKPMIEYYKQLP